MSQLSSQFGFVLQASRFLRTRRIRGDLDDITFAVRDVLCKKCPAERSLPQLPEDPEVISNNVTRSEHVALHLIREASQ
jgi:hypothetical protein